MTLTINGKDYIAQHFGVSNCFASNGINYTDPEGVSTIGSTLDVVSTLKMNIGGNARGPSGEVYIDIPDWGMIDDEDIIWIGSNDGFPAGEPKYCVSVTPPPPVPGLVDTYEFIGPPSGDPSIDLVLTDLDMRQNSADYHFEMNDMLIISKSTHTIYIAFEVRLFTGALTACPALGAAFVGMSRVSTTKVVRIRVLHPGDTMPINADFYQLDSIRGVHTVCLLVHGTWNKNELEAEIAGITE